MKTLVLVRFLHPETHVISHHVVHARAAECETAHAGGDLAGGDFGRRSRLHVKDVNLSGRKRCFTTKMVVEKLSPNPYPDFCSRRQKLQVALSAF